MERLTVFDRITQTPETLASQINVMHHCNPEWELSFAEWLRSPADSDSWDLFKPTKWDMNHIRELLDAEEQGRLVVLPCKVGDTVYSPRKDSVLENKVEYFTLGDGEPVAAVSFECDYECKGCPHFSPYTNYEAGDGGCDGEYGDGVFKLEDIGKTVFLTREEAEAALRKEQA